MNNEFKYFKENKFGGKAPVVLVGKDGANKEQKYLDAAVSDLGIVVGRVINEDLTSFTKFDAALGKLRTYLFNDLFVRVKEQSGSVVVFENIDKYNPVVLAMLVDMIEDADLLDSIILLSCESMPESLDRNYRALSKMKVMDIDGERHIGRDVDYPANVELAIYGEIAKRIVFNFTKIDHVASYNTQSFSDEINRVAPTLLSFVKAVSSIDGGLFGQMALQKGVNSSLTTTLTDFHETLKNTDIASIVPIIDILGPMIKEHEAKLTSVKVESPRKTQRPDESTLG